MKESSFSDKFTAFIVTGALLAGCLSGCATVKEGRVTGKELVRRVTARPAFTSEAMPAFEPGELSVLAVYPLEGSLSRSLPAGRSALLTERLVRALGVATSLEVLNVTASKRVGEAYERFRTQPQAIRNKARRFGRALRGDAVLVGVVTDFTEDNTHSREVEGESVGFRLWLVDTASGAELWTGVYRHANQPLSDNVLRLPQALRDHSVRYRSAAELADEGFITAARELERLRRESLGTK